MGRNSTGAVTVNDCLHIHVKTFTEAIKKGKDSFTGTMKWSTGANIGFNLSKVNGYYFVGLKYSTTDRYGTKQAIDYKVPLIGIPSNLGKGVIYSFLCPSSGKRCKTLYMAYDSKYFASRTAYKGNLYYPSQLSSRLNKHNDTYWRLTRKLEQLEIEHPKKHYKGVETKAKKRIEQLEDKRDYHDLKRWMVWPVQISKLIGLKSLL